MLPSYKINIDKINRVYKYAFISEFLGDLIIRKNIDLDCFIIQKLLYLVEYFDNIRQLNT